MNSYYKITTNHIAEAKTYAPTTGLPNQLYQEVINPTGEIAIVQADWTNDAAMDALGVNLGQLNPDGSAPQAVYDELAKPEWQYIE